MDENKSEIILFENGEMRLEVNLKNEDVWLTQKQMSVLFGKDQNTINEHINNIFEEEELDEYTSTGISGKSTGGRKPKIYNLDVIISVGYRVKSRNGTIFRKWANKVLKEHILKGYTINQKRLEYLEKTVKLIDIATRLDEDLRNRESYNMLKIISEYSKALNLLLDYDNKNIAIPKGNENEDKFINYDDCINVINSMPFKKNSDIFGLERNGSLEGIINNVYAEFGGEKLYKTIEEKACNLLYFIVKDHIFVDGNKRIGATLFLYFLNFYGLLYREGQAIITPETLVAITLLIAQSSPSEKDIMIDLLLNIINGI